MITIVDKRRSAITKGNKFNAFIKENKMLKQIGCIKVSYKTDHNITGSFVFRNSTHLWAINSTELSLIIYDDEINKHDVEIYYKFIEKFADKHELKMVVTIKNS